MSDFIINSDKETNTGYTFMFKTDNPVYLQPLHRDLPF